MLLLLCAPTGLPLVGLDEEGKGAAELFLAEAAVKTTFQAFNGLGLQSQSMLPGKDLPYKLIDTGLPGALPSSQHRPMPRPAIRPSYWLLFTGNNCPKRATLIGLQGKFLQLFTRRGGL